MLLDRYHSGASGQYCEDFEVRIRSRLQLEISRLYIPNDAILKSHTSENSRAKMFIHPVPKSVYSIRSWDYRLCVESRRLVWSVADVELLNTAGDTCCDQGIIFCARCADAA